MFEVDVIFGMGFKLNYKIWGHYIEQSELRGAENQISMLGTPY